jgi:tetratricopeptide (TPR) repeat protein
MSRTLQHFVDQLVALPRPPANARRELSLDTQALFSALLTNEFQAQYGAAGFAQADAVMRQFNEGVLLCRQDQLAAALAELQRGDEQLAALPAALIPYTSLFQLSGWGNYYYKAGEGERAVALLCQGLQLSIELEQQGHHALIYRRIEQLQNIATIYGKQQQYEAAIGLLTSTATFIHAGQATGLFVADWDAARLRQVQALQETTLFNVCRQLAELNTLMLASPTGLPDDYFHCHAGRQLLAGLEVSTYDRTLLYNWLYVKASFYAEGPDAFFANVLTFLADTVAAPRYGVFQANLLAQAASHIRQQATAQREDLLSTVGAVAERARLRAGGRAARMAA